MYETFDHTADLGLRVRATSLDELFADAGRGLCAMIVADLDDVRPTEAVDIQIHAEEIDYMLFDWLTELLYVFDTKKLLLSQFEVRVLPSGVEAVARGEALDPARHRIEHEVKAITYHGLKVEKQGDEWLAEVVVDI